MEADWVSSASQCKEAAFRLAPVSEHFHGVQVHSTGQNAMVLSQEKASRCRSLCRDPTNMVHDVDRLLIEENMQLWAMDLSWESAQFV